MAELDITATTAQVRLTTAEKIFGLLRDLSFPLSAVTSVTGEDDGLRAARGLRGPGLALPGRRKIGTWRGRGRRTLVSVRAGEPAIRIALTGQRFDEVVLSHPAAGTWADRLAEHVEGDRPAQ